MPSDDATARARCPRGMLRIAVAFAFLAALGASEAALPQRLLDTTQVPPTGATIPVLAGGDLQQAIDAAAPGDVIALQPGVTFTGNFVLPEKSGDGWITIRSAAPDGVLPMPGTRVRPADAKAMARLVTAKPVPVIATRGAAHHYRLIGLELTMSNEVSYGLVRLGSGTDTSAATLAHDLIIDRCWIHGSDRGDVQNGIRLDSAATAVIDSHIDQCQSMTVESHCIGGVNGPGPFRIVNNFLGGSTIQVLFGGARTSIPGLVPSDIEFRRNHCRKPTSWRPGSPDYAGTPWYVKNLFELKNARRVLIDGNVFEQNWPSADATPDGSPQQGYAILFTVRDEGQAWPTVADVTFSNNIVRRSNAGISLYGAEGEGAHRITIANNLFHDIGLAWGGNDRTGMIAQVNRVSHLVFDRNTMVHDGDIIFATTGGSVVASGGFRFTSCIASHGCARPVNPNRGINGVGTAPGTPTLQAFFGGQPMAVCAGNVLVQPEATLPLPDGNAVAADWAAVGFRDMAAHDYRLVASSPYRGKGLDGCDPGCDLEALEAAVGSAAGVAGQR